MTFASQNEKVGVGFKGMVVIRTQCDFFVTAMRRHMPAALLYTALFATVISTLPQTSRAEKVAGVPAIIVSKPTEIENATNIKAQPLALLAKFPEAGPEMARYVAQQLTQNPNSIDAMLSIISDTSPAQASAIGAGMVRAVRSLSAKQPAWARTTTEKVMRSDNKYLTTTYASLGPLYRPNVPFSAFTALPPHNVASGEVGFSMGAAWRVGPAENENFTERNNGQNNPGFYENCPVDSYGNRNLNCRGMIVAMMKSDASHNGAVSTSPTI